MMPVSLTVYYVHVEIAVTKLCTPLTKESLWQKIENLKLLSKYTSARNGHQYRQQASYTAQCCLKSIQIHCSTFSVLIQVLLNIKFYKRRVKKTIVVRVHVSLITHKAAFSGFFTSSFLNVI